MSEDKKAKKKGIQISNDSWRWLMLVCATIAFTVRKFQFYSISIIIAQLHLIYNTSMTELIIISVLPFTICNFASFLPLIVMKKKKKHPNLLLSVGGVTVLTLSSFLSSLVDQPHWLFLTFSILSGFGNAFASVCAMATVGEYFPRGSKHFNLATSLVLSSFPLAKLIFNPLSYLIIAHYNWRGVFILQGCCSLVCIFLSMSNLSKNPSSNNMMDTEEEEENIKSGNVEINEKDQKSSKSISPITTNDEKTTTFEMTELEEQHLDTSDTKMIIQKEESKGLWRMFVDSDCKLEMAIFSVSIALITTAQAGFYNIMPHFMMVRSFTNHEASVVMTMIGATELISVITAAIISYKLKGKLNFVFIGTHLCMTALFLGCIFTSTYHQILSCVILLGLNSGLFHAYTLSNATEISNLPVEVSWAFLCFSRAFGIFFIPIITGLIYDIEKNYNYSLLACSVVIFMACCGYIAISIIKFFKNKKSQ